MVDRGGPLDQAFFAGDGAGIFGTDVVEALLILILGKNGEEKRINKRHTNIVRQFL